ncbi:MAG TPA: hypothetical protein VN456_04320, partial [Desulfosporosinus sp.]|nr:hypothetical protein [Desulfosporosinus sp.]
KKFTAVSQVYNSFVIFLPLKTDSVLRTQLSGAIKVQEQVLRDTLILARTMNPHRTLFLFYVSKVLY